MNIRKEDLKPFWRKNVWLVSVVCGVCLLLSPLILLALHIFDEKLDMEDIKLFYGTGWKLLIQGYDE